MDKNKKATIIKRGATFLLDEAILFFPTFVLTMYIYIKLVNIGILNNYKFMPLLYLFSYPIPFLMTLNLFTTWLIGGSVVAQNELLCISFVPILLKIIIYTCFESSKCQASIGKKITQCYVINSNGIKMSFLRALVRNMVKYIFIIVFPPLILLKLHDVITKTNVILDEEGKGIIELD